MALKEGKNKEELQRAVESGEMDRVVVSIVINKKQENYIFHFSSPMSHKKAKETSKEINGILKRMLKANRALTDGC